VKGKRRGVNEKGTKERGGERKRKEKEGKGREREEFCAVVNFPRQNPACCPIAKEVENIDHGKSGHTKVYDPVLIMSPYPTRHFDRFSLFLQCSQS